MGISRGMEQEKDKILFKLGQYDASIYRFYERLVVGWLCFWSVIAAAQGENELPLTVRQALVAAAIDPTMVSVVVWGKDEVQPRLRWQAKEPRNPASLMKLVTGGVALEQWGPSKTWRTEIRRPPEAGPVASSLAVISAGDPDLTLARWQSLWRQIYQQGITTIAGDVIIESAAPGPAEVSDAFDGQGFRAYNVIPAPVQVDQQTQWWWIRPGQEGEPLVIWGDYPFPDVKVVNHTVTHGGACPALWREDLHTRVLSAANPMGVLPTRPNAILDQGVTVEWSGSLRQGCGDQVWGLSVLTNRHYLASTLRTLWQEQGGKWNGRLREGPINPTWIPVATSESRPLLEILMDMNRNSNNVVARHLYQDLIQSGGGSMEEQLAGLGLHFPEMVMSNGSGLSRHDRLAANSLALWLKWMQEKSAYSQEFMVTLPLAGQEGTVKRGFEELQGRHFRLKSGTLNQVKGLAGYGQDAEGHALVIVFMVNGQNAERAGSAELALLNWIASESKTPQPVNKIDH